MAFYLLYQLGHLGCLLVPKRISYWVAWRIADVYCYCSKGDRKAVFQNLETIMGKGNVSSSHVVQVFRNFAMYLVDFFGFDRLSLNKIKQFVRVDGLENMQSVLSQGEGAIGLTAHLGNYELAGAVLALHGLPVYAAVLTHRNPWVDRFFIRQRKRVGVHGIPVGENNRRRFFEKSLTALQGNGILALVGDRDFTDHGIELPFFGRTLRVPTGPATFSLKSGAAIVPGFLVRESNGFYRLRFEPPIAAPHNMPRQEAVRWILTQCLEVIARYVQKYPTQWYMFQEFWKPAPTFIR